VSRFQLPHLRKVGQNVYKTPSRSIGGPEERASLKP